MSDLTDNQFYPSTERIWLCIRLNNAGKWVSDRLAEDADFGKKSFFQMKLILKNRTHTLKSRRTQNVSLFGANFGQEAYMGHFSSKKYPYLREISINVNKLLAVLLLPVLLIHYFLYCTLLLPVYFLNPLFYTDVVAIFFFIR